MTVYPRMFRVRQTFERPRVDDIPGEVQAQLKRLALRDKVRPGASVAITAGSRGIANIALIIKAAVEHLKSLGAKPFIVPAMGSHGGGTAEGQREHRRRLRHHRGVLRLPDPRQHGDGHRLPDGRGLPGPLRQARLRGRSRARRAAASSRTRISSATSKAA